MKRAANPHLSCSGKLALEEYEQRLREREDLTPASIRNYLSDVRHFIAWYEQQREAHCQDDASFFSFHQTGPRNQARPRKLCQNVPWATSSKKYAVAARLPDISPHDLRHRFGYRMAEVVPLHQLAQIMGHDSLDTTKLYIQGTRHDLQQAVETIAWI